MKSVCAHRFPQSRRDCTAPHHTYTCIHIGTFVCYVSPDGTVSCRFNLIACSASLSLSQLSPRLLSAVVAVPAPLPFHSFTYPSAVSTASVLITAAQKTHNTRVKLSFPTRSVCLSPSLSVSLSPSLLLIVQLYINTAQRNALPPSFFPFASVSLLCSALLHLDK